MALLEVKDLKVHFPIRGGFFNTIQDHVRAVDGVSFQIEEGKTYEMTMTMDVLLQEIAN